MAISIGDALLKLGVDTKDLDRGLKGVGATIKKHHRAIGIGMTAMGGAILAAGALSVKTFAEMGDEVQKMALRTGFSTEALSELRHAAEISGASLSTLEKGVKRMSGTILDAQDGLETYIRAFQHIGIEVKELDGLNPEEQFLKIAEAIAEVEDPTKRAAIAQDIFGRAGTELLPLFAAGKEGLRDLREEAHKLGIVFDQEAANKAAEFNDAMTRMKSSVSGLKMKLAEVLIPILKDLIDKITDIVARVTDWAKEHPKLTDALVKFTGVMAGLMVVGGPLLIFAPTLGKILVAAKLLTGFIMTRMIPTIIALITALWAKAAAIMATVWAVTGPIGLAVALAGLGLIIAGTTLAIKRETDKLTHLTKATQAQTEATEEVNKQNALLVELAGNVVEVQDDITDAVERQAIAYQVLRNQIEAAFAAATRTISPPILEPFVSHKHKLAWAVEQAMWENRARAAARAGRTAEAGFAAKQAAAMQTRLQQLEFGGIAMSPMVASIAENKPEAVIPLDRLGEVLGKGQMMTIIYEVDGRQMAKTIMPYAVGEIRLKTGVRV